MFSRVRAEMGMKRGALVVPQRAVSEVQGRYLVAVVNPENKVAIKPVKVGQWFGQLWVIDEGLQAGEKVVAEGTQKVRDGMVVSTKPFVAEPQAKPGSAQKSVGKPETKPEAKPQPKPEKR
jgi:membrane fusion protein (multidrug efflux system)